METCKQDPLHIWWKGSLKNSEQFITICFESIIHWLTSLGRDVLHVCILGVLFYFNNWNQHYTYKQ